MTSVTAVEGAPVPATLGESPRWIQGALWWVDVHGGLLYRFADGRAGVVASLPDTVSFVLPRAGGGLVLGVGAQVVVADAAGAVEQVLVTLDGTEFRCNDAACDQDGNLYVGTMRRDASGREGRLFRIAPDGQREVLLDGLGIANGIAFDHDRHVAYFVDSRDGGIDAIDLRYGWIHGRSRWVDIDPADGLPDGLTLDREGAVWVALYDGGQVRRYLPDGTLDVALRLPVSQVTSCAFGGPGLDELYVTTAREHLSEAGLREQPLAGRLFRVRGAGRGRAPFAFAG